MRYTCAWRASRRMRRATSKPSIPGRPRSTMATSGTMPSMSARPLWPSAAVAHSRPAPPRSSDRSRRGARALAARTTRGPAARGTGRTRLHSPAAAGAALHLRQPRRVAVAPDGPVVALDGELQPVGVHEPARRLHRLLHHRAQIEPLLAQLDLVLRDAAGVEEVVEQARHLLRLAIE